MGNMTHEERLFLLAGVFLGASLAFAIFATGVLDPIEEVQYIKPAQNTEQVRLAESVPPVASVAPEVD